jgi:hypothetical protein
MDDDVASALTRGTTQVPTLRKSRDGFTRNDVVNAFQNAFEMMGGTTRLALWANANPDKFYPLYAKLLPSTSLLIGDAGALEIIHRLAPTALDRHEPVTVDTTAHEIQEQERVKDENAQN